MSTDGLKLVEELRGHGALEWRGNRYCECRYEVRRFQGMTPYGLPVPGIHRIEGRLAPDAPGTLESLVGADVVLRLEDGRALGITVANPQGQILSTGHGPSRCSCC